MSSENRTVKVTLKAEIADYVRSMLRGAAAGEKLGKDAEKAGRDIDRAMKESDEALKQNAQMWDRWGVMAKVKLAAVILAVGAFAASMLTSGIESNRFAEQAQISLSTMLGSQEAAKSALDDVYALATETPYQFPALIEQYQKLVASGMSLEKIIPTMRSYAGAVTAMGADAPKLELVSDAIAKIATLGKAETEQLNSMALNGIPVWQMLADAAGSSIQAVRKEVEKGLWDADRTIAVITAGMEERYGAMLENMSDSYQRWEDKEKGARRRTAEQVSKPVMAVALEVMRSLTSLWNAQTAAMKDVDWGPIINPLMALPRMLDEITATISAGGMQAVVTSVGQALELITAAGEALFHVMMPLAQSLLLASQVGTPLLSVLAGLLNTFNALPSPLQAAIVALGLFVKFQSPIVAMSQAAAGHVKAFTTTFSMLSTEASYAGAAMPRVTTAVAALGSTARAAGASLLAAFGGPVGLIVAGTFAVVTTALFAWTAATQDQEAATQSLTATLDANTGAITGRTAISIAEKLDAAGALEDMEALGLSTADVIQAVLDGGPALEQIKTKLREIESENSYRGEFGRALSEDGQRARDALAAVEGQSNALTRALDATQRQGSATADAVREIDGAVNVDTSAAQANLEALSSQAQKAFASFINLTPTKKKASSGGGGGGGGGESAAVKAAKAESAAVKKSADADKKAAAEHEKAAAAKSKAAREAADEAEKAADRASAAYDESADRLEESTFKWEAAQRQRAAIERTLAAETDPVRKAQLSAALADALKYEESMLAAKTKAERDHAAASTANNAAQQTALDTSKAASQAQAEYEAATARAAQMQEDAAARIEAAAEKMAAATEASSSRAGGAVSDFAEEAIFSLEEYKQQLLSQIAAQTSWHDNMLSLTGRVSSGTIQRLMSMGAEGAELVAALVRESDGSLQEWDRLFAASGDEIQKQMGDDLSALGVLVPAVTDKFGKDAAEKLKQQFREGKIGVDGIMKALGAEWDGKKYTLNIDAKTQAAIDAAGGLVKYIESLKPVIKIGAYGEVYVNGKPRGYMATGGPVNGPGPKGVDSVPIMAAPGEHMWTAGEVDAVGGQAEMLKLREMARQGLLKGSGPVASHPQQAAPSSGGGGSTTTIYQQIYYPVAEPSSVAAIRATRAEAG